MKRASQFHISAARLQRGAVAVEFALLSALFLLTLLIGWAWLRVSKTFMLFIVSFDHYTKK